MKPAEFYKIMRDFVTEQQYWTVLEIGDTVYDVQARGFENDYHQAEIVEINVDERFIYATMDKSVTPNKLIKLCGFITQAEFDKL